jgi:hypothetical protein
MASPPRVVLRDRGKRQLAAVPFDPVFDSLSRIEHQNHDQNTPNTD